MPELNLNGYTMLPEGKIAAVVTYLEMTSRPDVTAGAPPPGFRLERQSPVDITAYREVFKAVGEPWLWFSRLDLTDDALHRILNRQSAEVWFLMNGARPKGLLELDREHWPDVEIVYFGLTPDIIGRGAGSWLMRRALEMIWAQCPERVWLHTCTLDHPKAISFYIKQGFRAFGRAIEVADDPRLSGKLRRDAAPEVPLILSPAYNQTVESDFG
jgi:GNAT superfamily N-acetyltransferase